MCLQACLVFVSYSITLIKDITFLFKLCLPLPNHTEFLPPPPPPLTSTLATIHQCPPFLLIQGQQQRGGNVLCTMLYFALPINLQLDSSSLWPQATSESLAGKRLLLSHRSGATASGSLFWFIFTAWHNENDLHSLHYVSSLNSIFTWNSPLSRAIRHIP